jgi:hypothetical protein
MVIAAARQLAARSGPEGEWMFQHLTGMGLFVRGRYRQALAKFDFVTKEAPGGWVAANARIFGCHSCNLIGRYRELAQRGPRMLRQVEERGDLYTAVSLRTTTMAQIAITNDDPDEGRRHVREAMSHWSKSGFYVQHFYAMIAETDIELYAGDGARARARFERDARALRKSLMLHSAFARGMAAYLQGRCAIASIEAAPAARGARIAEARRIARRLEKDTATWAPTYAAIIHAGADNADGNPESAATRLREAVRHAEAADLDPQAWGARYQLGRLLGGDEGRELVAQAEQSMRDEGVRSPERIAGFAVPGRWG